MTRKLFFLLILAMIFQSCDVTIKTEKEQSHHSMDHLDSLFNAAIENHEIPAAVAFIAQNGEEVYHKAFGWKNMEKDQALVQSDIFRIASMTKSVTAVGILQLVERGLLSLDDPVSKYIPEFKDPFVLIDVLPDSTFTGRPAKREITIHHLLTHTSGIGYGFQSEKYNALVLKNGITEGFEERPIELQENIKRIAKLPLFHDPGDDWTYSLSFDVLGAVIEIASGEKLDNYFHQHIFEPLGMMDTYFYLPDEKFSRLVTVYEHNMTKNGFIPATYEMTEYPVQGAKTYLSGGADLSCTTNDIGIFAHMLLNGGEYKGARILGSSYVEMMTTKQSEHGWWDSVVGFGVSITTRAGAEQNPQSEGAFGFGGFYDTYCWVDPDHGLVAILLLQMYPNNEFGIHQKFQHLTYGIID